MRRRKALSTLREHTGAREDDAIWQRLDEVVRFLAACPIADGRLLTEEAGAVRGTGLSFISGTTRSLPHGLGRHAVGFFEVYSTGLVSANHVGLRTAAHPSGVTSATHVSVTPSADGTCFVWVF